MIDAANRTLFESLVSTGESADLVESAARRIRSGAPVAEDVLDLTSAFAHAAFVAPERLAQVYDAAATGWFGDALSAPPIPMAQLAPTPLSDAFWRDFWELIETASKLGSGDVTTRVAALSGLLDPAHQVRVAAASGAYPNVMRAAQAGYPRKIQLSELAAWPEGSLGEAFYRLIVDNGFDLEVLDRDDLGLSLLAPPLDYLNARILQTHDLWHIIAGYRTTKLHEVAISGFQMAQFGHGYSALFLALVFTIAAFTEAPPFAMMMDTILGAWVHGRRTPSMLLIPWEQEWAGTIADIRQRYQVEPYASPYPADLFEQFEAAA